MSKSEIREGLSFLKGKNSENIIIVMRVDNLLDLLNELSDSDIEKIKSYKYFASVFDNQSRIDTAESALAEMIEETRYYIKAKQKQEQGSKQELQKQKQIIKESALVDMRQSRRGVIVGVIIFLSFITVIAVVLGVLGAVNIIPDFWCDIIGVADCGFGIIFFIYEFSTDKLKENKINCGNVETIQKYIDPDKIQKIIIKTGDNTGNTGGVNNSGIILGNVSERLSSKEITDALNSIFNN